MPEKFNQPKNEQEEDFTQGLDYPTENEAGFDGLLSEKNPDLEKERIFDEYEAKKIREWVKTLIKQWHDEIKPDYIFVTDTSAVPHGYVIKEAWRNAYRDENAPHFFKINPRAQIMGEFGKDPYGRFLEKPNKDFKPNSERELLMKKFLAERVKMDSPRIIVFDEGDPNDSFGMEALAQYAENGQHIPQDFGQHNFIAAMSEGTSGVRATKFIFDTTKYLKKEASIWTSRQARQEDDKDYANKHGANGGDYIYWRAINNKPTVKRSRKESTLQSIIDRNKTLPPSYRKGYLDEGIIGTVVRDQEQKKKALHFINELKEIGKQAGQELRTQLENEASHED